MTARRVQIIGGGPAGLLTARLLARSHPGWSVRLAERLPPEDTFGFGVGLTRRLMTSLQEADAQIHDAIAAAMHPFASAEFRLPQGDITFGQFHSGAISRARLLRILLDGARQAGAQVEIGAAATVNDALDRADLVIAADGVSSTVRDRHAAEFGPQTGLGRGLFIWCAAPVALDGTVFTPARTPDGVFVAHSYPYGDGWSTFVIEASERTLERAGFTGRGWADEDDFDREALAYLSEAFAPLLRGAVFTGNRSSRWSRFRTLRCARWQHGRVVLLGDAAATAHPSLGSGTKIALESAIALAAALGPVGDEAPASVLAGFEQARRPAVERLQDTARRSQLWWESFEARQDLSPARLAVAYLSRAGAVSLSDLAASAPDVVTRAAADFAGVRPGDVPGQDLAGWVLHRPLTAGGRHYPGRLRGRADPAAAAAGLVEVGSGDAWGPAGQEYLDKSRGRLGPGAGVIRLTGPAGRAALLDRLAVAERIRRDLGAVTEVSVPAEHLGLAVDGLVAGRADLIILA